MKIIIPSGLVAALAGFGIAASAFAAEGFKPGKWEFSVQIQMPNMPQLPPGVTLPPGMHISPGGGMSVTHTSCLTDANPVPADKPPGQRDTGDVHCKVDKMERKGGDVQWASTCTSPDGTMRSEGDAHYRGDTMEANFMAHTTSPGGPPTTVSQHMTGRYIGACDAK